MCTVILLFTVLPRVCERMSLEESQEIPTFANIPHDSTQILFFHFHLKKRVMISLVNFLLE